MDNRKKRKLTFFTIGLMFLLSGVEYGKTCFISQPPELLRQNKPNCNFNDSKKRNKGLVLLWHTSVNDSLNREDKENWKGNFSSDINFLKFRVEECLGFYFILRT